MTTFNFSSGFLKHSHSHHLKKKSQINSYHWKRAWGLKECFILLFVRDGRGGVVPWHKRSEDKCRWVGFGIERLLSGWTVSPALISWFLNWNVGRFRPASRLILLCSFPEEVKIICILREIHSSLGFFFPLFFPSFLLPFSFEHLMINMTQIDK